MRLLIAIFLLSTPVLAASPSQDLVNKHFAEVIEAQMRLMFEAQFAEHPNHPLMEQRKQEVEGVIAKTIPDAFKAFAPELNVTEDEAKSLVATEPDKDTNIKQIKANRETMNKSPLPKPLLVTTMFTTYEKNPDQSSWFFETLKRLTAGTIRELRERGELK